MNYKVVKINNIVSYGDGLDLQHKVFDLVDADIYDGVLLLLEHKHVLTMGIRTNYKNLLVTEQFLKEKGVELFEIDRGGDITYHGPGQIIGYFIMKIKKLNLRLSDYMHNLEKVVIDTLSIYDLKAYQREDYPGVWVDGTKICAIGVRAKKYITYHGLALNVKTDKSFFNLINPCGITDFNVSSLDDFIKTIDIEIVKDNLIKSYEKIFNIKLEEISLVKVLKV